MLAGCATSAVAAPATGTATTQSGPVRVMPLGDSITDGYTVEGGYRTRLWTLLTADHVAVDLVGSRESGPAELGDKANEGHVGLRADEITAQVTPWLTQARPDIVLLHIGTNDLGEVSGAETAAHLDALLAEIYRVQPRTHVVVATIIPMFSGVAAERDAYNAAIPGIVARYRSASRAITKWTCRTCWTRPRTTSTSSIRIAGATTRWPTPGTRQWSTPTPPCCGRGARSNGCGRPNADL